MNWISPVSLNIKSGLILSIGCFLATTAFATLATTWNFYVAHRFPVADLCWNPVNFTHSLISDLASYNPFLCCLNLNNHLLSRTRTLPMCLNIVPYDIFLLNMNPLPHFTSLYQVKNNAVELLIWLKIINQVQIVCLPT